MTDGRRHVSLYLGKRDLQALDCRPRATKRGRWINLQAAVLTEWSDEDWKALKQHLPARPARSVERLSVAIPGVVASALDAKRGHIPLPDVLRAAMLRAAGIEYRPVAIVRPWSAEPSTRTVEVEATAPAKAPAPDKPPASRWRERSANSDELQEFIDMVCEGRLDHDLCHRDATPRLLQQIGSWSDEARGSPYVAVLGVAVRRKGLEFVGVDDLNATVFAIRLALDSGSAIYDVDLLRFEYEHEPPNRAMLVTVQAPRIRLKRGKKPRRRP